MRYVALNPKATNRVSASDSRIFLDVSRTVTPWMTRFAAAARRWPFMSRG